jgi:hypothetical protein
VPETDGLRCRYYENQYPEPEEVVVCNVTDITDTGADVTLLEYDNIKVILSQFPSSCSCQSILCCVGDGVALRTVEEAHTVNQQTCSCKQN